MSRIIKYPSLLVFVFALLVNNSEAQSTLDSIQLKKEFNSLDEALINPENVYRLNLSEQEIEIADTIWSKFTNLQYLSLKNDHLKQIPDGLGNLKSLKVLDLSGNDFKVLPSSFSNLVNLEELFINDDKYFRLDKNIPILSQLPNLTTLHLENDGLKSLPKNTASLIHIESLYLNNNEFKELPEELNGLDSLKFIDFHDNKLSLPPQEIKNKNFGIKIRF
jgi:Leucine-rich repeat (LRR) protein